MTVTPLADKLAADLKSLPQPDSPYATDNFFTTLAGHVVFYHALKRESELLGPPEIFPYLSAMTATAELLYNLDKIYDFKRQAMLRSSTKFSEFSLGKLMGAIDLILDDRLKRETKGKRNVRKHSNYDNADLSTRTLRDALFCLNPMYLDAADLTEYMRPDVAQAMRVGSKQTVANMRAAKHALSIVSPLNPNKSRANGARRMEPIDPETGAKYYQTYDCFRYGHLSSGFYKFHSIAWARKRYAEIIAGLGYATCPIYGVPVANYTANAVVPGCEMYDLRYLEIAEYAVEFSLNFIGLRENKKWEHRHFIHGGTYSLPLYSAIYEGEAPTQNDFTFFKVPYASASAHEEFNTIDPSWQEPKKLGTSIAMLTRKLVEEKARFIPELADRLERMQTVSKIADRRFYEELNDAYKVRNEAALKERLDAVNSLTK